MAANDLSSNPLYDTEDNDDGDRRLATSSFMPRTRREPDGFGVEAGKKKQAKANTKSFSGTAGIKLATSKMFGTFDVSDFIAEDEMTINASKRDDTYTGSIHEREFVLDDQIEKKKKEITWNSSPVVGQRVTQEKRSIEKHEEQMTRQGESRFLNGILNQTIVFDQRDDIEIVVTNENKPSGLPQTQVNQIQSSLTSGFGITQSLVQPQTSMNESMIKQKSALGFSFTPTLGSQFSQSLYPLKRSSLNNDLPIRDRNDLKKILTKSMYDRRKQVTNEEIMRSMKETDFTKADELQPDEHSKEQQNGRPMDEEKRPGKLDISEIAALEEGDADYDPEGSEQEFEEGYDEVKKEIERMENLMMSDDEDQILKSRIGDESNPQSAHEKRENSNMNQNKRTDASDSDEDDSNFLDDEADEGEEGDEEEIEEDEGTSQVGVDNQLEAEEVIDDESNPAEQKIMRRLKKAKDVKAAKKAEKRKRRAERHAKFIENEKKRKEFLRTTDLIEHEADLGEVIDGKDAGMKRINREDEDEVDDDTSSRDLEELLADIEDFDEENEGGAYRQHVLDMMEDDKELLKKVIKGKFRDSIMKRTEVDKEAEREMKKKRLEAIKKMIAEYNEFQTAFKTKDDKYRKLLGLDEEELQSEALLLESSLKKEVKQSAERSAIPRESTGEKNRKKDILNRLKISDVSNTSHNQTRKLFFDSSISKNQNLMKAIDSFDVNKKTQLPSNQIFVFRKKHQPE